jgi:uncharacterized SAM-binding protein YcdF (DUF218 family)
MFFVVSKVLGFLSLPSNLLLILGLAGVVLIGARKTRAGLSCLVASVLLLAVCGLSPLGNAVMVVLEDRFPPWSPTGGPPDGIIMLGGALDPVVEAARGQVALNEAAERLTSMVELARQYPFARIVLSGGIGGLDQTGETEAVLEARLLERLGIPQSRLLLEDRSRDTDENALQSKAIAHPLPGERWLLVTSAYHMPRAVGAFRRVGFAVEAYPVDWRTRGPKDLVRLFSSVSDGLKRLDTAVHEWVGLLVYWLTGRSSALFPGPTS